MIDNHGHPAADFHCVEADRVTFQVSKEHGVRDKVQRVFRNGGKKNRKSHGECTGTTVPGKAGLKKSQCRPPGGHPTTGVRGEISESSCGHKSKTGLRQKRTFQKRVI